MNTYLGICESKNRLLLRKIAVPSINHSEFWIILEKNEAEIT